MTYNVVAMKCAISSSAAWHQIYEVPKVHEDALQPATLEGCFHMPYWTLRGSVNSDVKVSTFNKIF